MRDTEDKAGWCKDSEAWERFFADTARTEFGLDVVYNEEKRDNPTLPDLLHHGEYAELKNNFTPFFKAGVLYDIDPRFAFAFNLKDRNRFKKYYKAAHFFWVWWLTLETPLGRVKPVNRIYQTIPSELDEILASAPIHSYKRRVNDSVNAKDSYIFDIRLLTEVGRIT